MWGEYPGLYHNLFLSKLHFIQTSFGGTNWQTLRVRSIARLFFRICEVNLFIPPPDFSIETLLTNLKVPVLQVTQVIVTLLTRLIQGCPFRNQIHSLDPGPVVESVVRLNF